MFFAVLNSNAFKTFLMSLIWGVGFAVGFCVAEIISNAAGITDLSNDQLSNHALIAFGVGIAVCLIYSLKTKRQW